jgi:nitrogen fixation-related uncharacterized protein
MKMGYKPTPAFTIAVTIIASLVAVTWWFFWAIDQAQANDINLRALSAAQHNRCAAMPRGNQVTENARRACFDNLYDGRVKIE